MPQFWIVAGPNGAGKSTVVERGVIRDVAGIELQSLNADQRTREILKADPDAADANLRAAIEIDAQVAAFIENGVDFLVETVLSSEKYLDDVERAIALRFRIGMVYVALDSPALAVARVATRVRLGGHAVPRERIEARWKRSIDMLGRMAPLAHRLFVYDNSGLDGPVLIARKKSGAVNLLAPGRIPEIDEALGGSDRST
jgi:predicted ABC-type ATPase